MQNLMGFPNPIGTGKVAADLQWRRDKATPIGLAGTDPLGNLVFSSKDELWTTLVIFTDFSHEAGAGSRKFNIAHLDFFPEIGIK